MNQPFVDYYEVLQLSPNATPDTIERVFRLLAKRYHPDNQDTGDVDQFNAVTEAHAVLGNADRRAQYDVAYEKNRGLEWKIFDQQSATSGREYDQRLFHGILSLLYVARRRDPKRGGLGAIQIERLLGVPEQHLAFPMWYLKQHGWIEILDSGQYGITVQGIDKLGDSALTLPAERLWPESGASSDSAGKKPHELALASGQE